jgi:hypothetical protein
MTYAAKWGQEEREREREIGTALQRGQYNNE